MNMLHRAVPLLIVSLLLASQGELAIAQSDAKEADQVKPWPKIKSGELKKDGAFGFPAAKATTLCDTDEIRLQSVCDDEKLVVQAILWNDGDNALGETRDGREIGDSSNLLLDVDLNGKKTPKLDRTYCLDPWPSIPGLRYSILYERGSSHIKGDSIGRGSIRYFEFEGEDKTVRVDTYVIPFSEINVEAGSKIGVAYLGSSTSPEFTVNSIGYESERKKYYSFSLPFEKFHKVELAAISKAIDDEKIPAGREDEEKKEKKKVKPKPAVGTVPPALQATAWLNTEETPTLETLKGKVVLLDFWATWCGPCVAGIPHLNDLHEKHSSEGLQVLSFTDQSRKGIENFQENTKVNYPSAVGSELHVEYGVTGFPTAFIIGRDGKVVWHGNPAADRETMDEKILEELGK